MRKVYLAFLVITFAIVVTWPRTGQGQKDGNLSHGDTAYVEGELLVQFKVSSTNNDKASAYRRINAEELEVVLPAKKRSDGRGDLVLVRHRSDYSPQAAVNALNSDSSVEFTEPNWIYTHQATSNDTYYTNGQLWGMYGATTSPANPYGSNAAAAWANDNTGRTDVYVGIIDEGIQFNHKDLKGKGLNGQVWVNPYESVDGVDNDGNGYKDDMLGWDFDGNNKTIYDGGRTGTADDHGTHVSGTIGALGGNGKGVVGVNWNITLISAKFLGRYGGTTANAVKAVDYITDLKTRHGLNIVATNNSWGGGGFSQALQDAIERANAANILFIAAAGNASNNNDIVPNYPSNYPNTNIIAVASITSTGGISSFSNYGVTTVDIGAPGSGIWSTTAYNTYSSYNGTSMATPHVTGAAALYASTHPGASAAQIKNAILSGAVPTASLSGKVVTGGRLDANAALNY